MSINFSTLQGLTIPEGVVTQIADASGRVIWSASKTVNVLYLRPSADISVGHSLYPADSPSAYSLVNEEVNDGNSTYIYSVHADTDAADEATSSFVLSPTKHAKAKSVTSGTIVYDHVTSSGVQNPFIYHNILKVGETDIDYLEYSSTLKSDVTTYERELQSDELEAINSYVSQNGTVPSITFEIKATGTCSSSKNDGNVSTGQIYIELTGEFVI